MEGKTGRAAGSVDSGFDRLNKDWYIDKAVQVLVFIGGISAIIFIIGIFVFITKEGAAFLFGDLDIVEFFTSPRWRPTSEHNPTYGIFALIVGTASVTGLAMIWIIWQAFQGLATLGDIVLFYQVDAHTAHVIQAVAFGYARVVIVQPVVECLFRRHEYGPVVPQGVIQVKGQGSDMVHWIVLC